MRRSRVYSRQASRERGGSVTPTRAGQYFSPSPAMSRSSRTAASVFHLGKAVISLRKDMTKRAISRYLRVLFRALRLALVACWLAVVAFAQDPGTVGLGFGQLYLESAPNKRGPLVVLQVEQNSPAIRADINRGDLVIAVNGYSVVGRDVNEIVRKDVHGAVGSTLRLTVAKIDGGESELTLVRAPYQPRTNPASDPFFYSFPGNWRKDPRYSFPLPWTPGISHVGIEDLAFTPNFDDTNSPEYHSYMFFWWIQGTDPITSAQIQADMIQYFRGLAEERGKDYHFTPDLSRVTARYNAMPTALVGGSHAQHFGGAVSLYDTHGKVLELQSEVTAVPCLAADHTAFFFEMSAEQPNGAIWKQLDAVRDSFRCRR
jgi:hypothetical protein